MCPPQLVGDYYMYLEELHLHVHVRTVYTTNRATIQETLHAIPPCMYMYVHWNV